MDSKDPNDGCQASISPSQRGAADIKKYELKLAQPALRLTDNGFLH